MKLQRGVLNNQRGSLTLDFMFASVLVFSFIALLFAICLTLSTAFITQYIAFASARSYMAAHMTEEAQQTQGLTKFAQLSQGQALGSLLSNQWFEIVDINVGDYNETLADEESLSRNSNTFVGAIAIFRSKILEFQVPFFGSTFTEEDGFSARISAFLAREPSHQEGEMFSAERFERIQGLGGYAGDPRAYAVICDNGC
jgi:hypothetical protein